MLPGNKAASSSSSRRVGCASTEQKAQESSLWKWWRRGRSSGRWPSPPHRLRESYARAIVPSVVFAMERAAVERLIEEKPQVGIRMISLLSERLHFYETRMEDVTLREVPARLASLILFLIESEGIQVPGEISIPTRYTHEHLGTMIGANRESVTRAFGRLQDEGAVQI